MVTGASSGIGQAAAIALARDNWAVFAHGFQNQTGLDETRRTIESLGQACRVLVGDLTTESARSDLVTQAFEWSSADESALLGWVNVAGADVLTGDAAEFDFDTKLRQVWQLDVVATVALSRAAGERMQPVGGAIVNIGWDQAALGMEGDSGQLFGATKAAIAGFTLSLAKSLAPQVRVNCVAPGWIRTKWGQQASPHWQQRAISECLLQRWGTADDVASTICWLLSERASFVNGQIIQVNGGFAGSVQ